MVEPGAFEPVKPPRGALPELKARGAGEIIGAALKLYGARWRVFIPVAAVFMVPYAFFSALASARLFAGLGPEFFTDPDVMPAPDELFSAFLPFLGVLGLFLLFYPVMVGALAWAAARTYLGETPAPTEVMRFAFSRMGSLLWVVLLTFGAFLGILLVLVPIAILIGDSLVIIPVILLFFLVVAAVFVRLLFAPMVVMVEDVRGTAALGRSWNLVGGYFWKVVGTTLLAAILTGIVDGIVTAPLSFASQALLTGDGFVMGTMLTFLAGVISGVLIQPFSAVVQALLYFDLRIRKEQFDVSRASAAGGAAPESTAGPALTYPPPPTGAEAGGPAAEGEPGPPSGSA